MDANGCLPPGRHATTLEELHRLFVLEAPNRQRREDIHTAFLSWLSSVRVKLPGNLTLWIDGSFVTHKTAPPKDIDVLLLVRDRRAISALSHMAFLLLSAQLSRAGHKPENGLVDAYLTSLDNQDRLKYWDRVWRSVRDDAGGILAGRKKGYLEVTL